MFAHYSKRHVWWKLNIKSAPTPHTHCEAWWWRADDSGLVELNISTHSRMKCEAICWTAEAWSKLDNDPKHSSKLELIPEESWAETDVCKSQRTEVILERRVGWNFPHLCDRLIKSDLPIIVLKRWFYKVFKHIGGNSVFLNAPLMFWLYFYLLINDTVEPILCFCIVYFRTW